VRPWSADGTVKEEPSIGQHHKDHNVITGGRCASGKSPQPAANSRKDTHELMKAQKEKRDLISR